MKSACVATKTFRFRSTSFFAAPTMQTAKLPRIQHFDVAFARRPDQNHGAFQNRRKVPSLRPEFLIGCPTLGHLHG